VTVIGKGVGRFIDVPVGNALLGRIVDATGRPLDTLAPLGTSLSLYEALEHSLSDDDRYALITTARRTVGEMVR